VAVKADPFDHFSGFDNSLPTFTISPAPRGLRHLTVGAGSLSADLFHHTRDTLTSLELRWSQGDGHVLEQPKASMDHVTHFTLKMPTSPDQAELHPNLGAFVGFLPGLTRLTVHDLWPQQLEELLLSLAPAVRLAELATVLWEPHPTDFGRRRAKQAEIAAEWEAALQRCVRLPAMGQLRRLRLSVRRWGATFGDEDDEGEMHRYLFLYGRFRKEEWVTFAREVAAAGIELVLGPLEQ
jgi:hypothetical protein